MLPGAKHKLRWLQLSIKCHCKCGGKNGRPAVKKLRGLVTNRHLTCRTMTHPGPADPERDPHIFSAQNQPKPYLFTHGFTAMLLKDTPDPRTAFPVRKPPECRPKGLGIEVRRHLKAHKALLAHPSPRAIWRDCGEEIFCSWRKTGRQTADGETPRSLSSSPSPERIDEKVGGESPLIDEHTGSGGIRYSA